MKYKKGQVPKSIAAAPVATLIAIIALFMILYILLLPPSERHELLNMTDKEGKTVGGVDSKVLGESELLLSVNPGVISLDVEDKTEHELTPSRLFVKVEPEVTTLLNSMYISRNIFSNKFQEVFFNVRDITSLDSATIVFNVDSSDGRLIVELNNNVIFNKEIKPDIITIPLPLGYLREQNTLKFYVSSPGALFFTSNKYTLSNIKLSQKYEIINAKSERSFSLTGLEKENLEKAELDFGIYCETLSRPEGTLKVRLNDYPIHNEMVICDRGTIKKELDIDYLKKGENILEFEVDKGDYNIDPINIITELETGAYLNYNFFLETEEFEDVWNGDKKVNLELLFADEEQKNARFDINGNTVRLNTEEISWDRDISGIIKEGNNYLKIIPSNEFDITSLEIILK